MCLSSQCGRVLAGNSFIIIEYPLVEKRNGKYMHGLDLPQYLMTT